MSQNGAADSTKILNNELVVLKGGRNTASAAKIITWERVLFHQLK